MARTAALMGDTGFLKDYNSNISWSVEFARENLPKFKYNENQIQQVIQLLEKKGKANANSSHVEKIMADAETVYYGRVDFISLAENLFKELNEMQIVSSREGFIQRMSKTLSEHQYFTESARRLVEIEIKDQLEQVKKLA